MSQRIVGDHFCCNRKIPTPQTSHQTPTETWDNIFLTRVRLENFKESNLCERWTLARTKITHLVSKQDRFKVRWECKTHVVLLIARMKTAWQVGDMEKLTYLFMNRVIKIQRIRTGTRTYEWVNKLISSMLETESRRQMRPMQRGM